jgi:hypothetical protein
MVYLFAVDSIGSIFTRGLIWFAIAVAILAGVDTYDKHKGEAFGLKTDVGFFFLFLVLGGALIFLLFGFTPFLGTVNAHS